VLAQGVGQPLLHHAGQWSQTMADDGYPGDGAGHGRPEVGLVVHHEVGTCPCHDVEEPGGRDRRQHLGEQRVAQTPPLGWRQLRELRPGPDQLPPAPGHVAGDLLDPPTRSPQRRGQRVACRQHDVLAGRAQRGRERHQRIEVAECR
jgi:hypothetical protein